MRWCVPTGMVRGRYPAGHCRDRLQVLAHLSVTVHLGIQMMVVRGDRWMLIHVIDEIELAGGMAQLRQHERDLATVLM